MNKRPLFIVLALAVAVAGPAASHFILVSHTPDESMADHFFATPEITNLAGDSVLLVLAAIFLALALWSGFSWLTNLARGLFCGWYNSAYLEANNGTYSGTTTPRHLKGPGLIIFKEVSV